MGRRVIIISLLLLAYRLETKIIESAHLANLLQFVRDDTLLILDIDNTLAEPEQLLGSEQWFHHTVHECEQSGLSVEQAKAPIVQWYIDIHLVSWLKPVEAYTSQFIQHLQVKGISIIGLTARPVALINRTREQLKRINIDFSVTALSSKELCGPVHFPYIFKNGILFSRNDDIHAYGTKGEALILFLHQVGYKPKHIIFVDDRLHNVQAVEKALMQWDKDITFIGIRYSRLDEKVAAYNPISNASMRESHVHDVMITKEAPNYSVE